MTMEEKEKMCLSMNTFDLYQGVYGEKTKIPGKSNQGLSDPHHLSKYCS